MGGGSSVGGGGLSVGPLRGLDGPRLRYPVSSAKVVA